MTHKDCNDDCLIQMAICGDMVAFEEIYLRYKSFAFAVANRHLKNYHMAEDVTQDTFAKLICKLHLFSKKGMFKSFLARIVSNSCKDIMRKRRMLSIDFAVGIKGEAVLVDLKQNQPIDIFVKKEIKQAVRNTVNGLPTHVANIFRNYWFDDMKLSAIAVKYSMPLGSVKSLIYSTMHKMRRYLNEFEN